MAVQNFSKDLREIEWLIFDFFWTLYRITPTPVAILQRFLKQLKAPLSPKPLEIVKRFAVADGILYQQGKRTISAAAISKLHEIDEIKIQKFFTTNAWQNIANEIKPFISSRYIEVHPEVISQLFVQWHQYWRKPDRQARIIPESLPVLRELTLRGYKIIVASNSPWDLKPILTRDGITNNIHKVITYKDTGYQKPSVNFFRAMLKQLKIPKKKIAFIGDSITNDIKPAQTVGVLPVLIWRPGQHRHPPPPLQNVIIIRYLKDLLQILP